MMTGVPMRTCVNRNSASGIRIRMQPCEAEYPIDAASGVPWIPTAGADKPIQRVPSGLPGPGGIGSASFAQSDGGGRHHGLRCMSTIDHVPSGVGYDDWPVATPKLLTARGPLKRVRRFEARRITMTGPKFAAVTFGCTGAVGSMIAC